MNTNNLHSLMTTSDTQTVMGSGNNYSVTATSYAVLSKSKHGSSDEYMSSLPNVEYKYWLSRYEKNQLPTHR